MNDDNKKRTSENGVLKILKEEQGERVSLNGD